jgi:hypothetical protein
MLKRLNRYGIPFIKKTREENPASESHRAWVLRQSMIYVLEKGIIFVFKLGLRTYFLDSNRNSGSDRIFAV